VSVSGISGLTSRAGSVMVRTTLGAREERLLERVVGEILSDLR
jgi:hypothetical protein